MQYGERSTLGLGDRELRPQTNDTAIHAPRLKLPGRNGPPAASLPCPPRHGGAIPPLRDYLFLISAFHIRPPPHHLTSHPLLANLHHLTHQLTSLQALTANKSIHHISTAIHASRPSVTDIVPGSPLRHFLYKSRGNVQFLQPSYAPYFPSPLSRRQLLTLYARLHATLHARPAGVKIMHQVGGDCIALAWSTPLFELFAVAPVSTSRQALAQGAMRVVQWVRREEERVFIIGGAVF